MNPCVRSLSENMESRAKDRVRSIIETERFLAVRQIVEKMSIFISQVGRYASGVKMPETVHPV